MSESPQTGYEQLSDTAALLIDQVCEKFEHALRHGKRPTIEEQLSSLPDKLRSVLLRELILVEVPHLRKAGQTPQWQEYRARFPGLDEEWLTQVIPASGSAPVHASGVSFPPAYEFVGEVGRGGMGVVFKARDTRLGRFVAVKMLPPELAQDPQFVKRFAQEARAAGALNHPSVCTIHAFEEWQEQLFLIMEWIDGRTVRSLLKAQPGLQTVVGWIAQAAQALQAAHALGIVHRDIKPENMMVRSDGLVKVLDFGLARMPNQNSLRGTTPGLIMGTARYMSPEQARGERVDSPTDIFALGVMLYECTTGEHPFPAGTLSGMLQAIETRLPAAPSTHNPDVPESLDRLILQMLAKDPQARPPASQVAIELKDHATSISSRSTVRTLHVADLPPPAKSTDKGASAVTGPVDPPARKRWPLLAAALVAALALIGILVVISRRP